MTRSNKSSTRLAAVAAALLTIATSGLMIQPAGAGKYKHHSVTQKASFHTLKKHAHSLQRAGVAKVTKIKRHGRVVGIKKQFTGSGKKVIIKRGRHGRVTTTTLKRKSFFQRLKHKFSFSKSRRHAFNGFRRH